MTKEPHRGFSRRALIGSGAAASVLAVSAAPAVAAARALRIAAPAVDRDALIHGPAVRPGLTTIWPDGALRPALARAYAGEDGGRRWRFDLDPDARFADGAPVTAAAVAQALRPALAQGRLRRGRAGQLVIDLPERDPHLPYRLGDPAFGIARADGAGAGAWRAERAPSGAWRITPVQGVGRVFEVIALADPADRLAALRSRRVDLALDLPEGARPGVAQDDLCLALAGADDALAGWLAAVLRGADAAAPARGAVTLSLAPEISESAAARPFLRRLIGLAAGAGLSIAPASRRDAALRVELAGPATPEDRRLRLPRHAGLAAGPLAAPFSAALIPLDRRFA